MKCNRCERSLLGNEYQDHWKNCSKRRIIKSDIQHNPGLLLSKEKKRIKRLKKKMSWRKSNHPAENASVKTHWVYSNPKFRIMRYPILAKYNFKCLPCGASNTELHVDHIKPISKYPELAFSFNNLQVLCRDCNLSKSNNFEHDLRSK